MAWRPMRRGIADLHGRAEVSRKAAERYLDAFASVASATPPVHPTSRDRRYGSRSPISAALVLTKTSLTRHGIATRAS